MVKRKSYQSPSSYNSDPTRQDGVSVTHLLRVRRLKPTEALTGLRVLFTRFAAGLREEDFSPEEVLFISEAADRLSKVRDLNFLKFHWVHLEQLQAAIRISSRNQWKYSRSVSRKVKSALTSENDPSIKEKHYSLIPNHEYYGNFLEWSVKSYIVRDNLLSKKRHPPQRFVGVGYRDKGTRKINSTDASPAWQEVASSPVIYDNGRILDPGSLNTKTIRVKAFNPLKS